MRKYFFLAIAIMLVSPLAWSFILSTDPMPRPYQAPSLLNKWFSRIEAKKVQQYTLDNLYNLQIFYPQEKIINLNTTNYMIQFTSESAEEYLGVQVGAPGGYLRQVSGRALGLILYRLGGDGTDHYTDCQYMLIRQLPQKQITAYVAEWSATFSGLIFDFEGACAELGGPSAHYVYLQITYDPINQTGEIFVGGEEISGLIEPRVDLFNVDGD